MWIGKGEKSKVKPALMCVATISNSLSFVVCRLSFVD